MTGYELRVWPIPFDGARQPLETIRFTANSDIDAEQRMRACAAALPRVRQVFLHRDDCARSIASEDGLA